MNKWVLTWHLATTSACSANKSTNLPFPSSPHWDPRTTLTFMAIWVVKFSKEGYKIRKLNKNQHTLRKLLNFENWFDGEVSKRAKIWHSKSVFYVKNYGNLPLFYLVIEEYQFRSTFLWNFLIISIFKSLHFLKRCSIFDFFPLHWFSTLIIFSGSVDF